MLRSRSLVLALVPALSSLVLLVPAQPQARQRTDADSRIWIGRYQEIEEYLRTAECVGMDPDAVYRPSVCTFPPGGPVARMVWKPITPYVYRGFLESYKNEIAAYEIDKLLQMDMLPPTVERELHGRTGAGILLVENVVQWDASSPPDASIRGEWDKQVARMTMFDNLINNVDRNRATNVLRDGAWNLVLAGHAVSFRADPELPFQLTTVDASYWDRVQALTPAQLDERLGRWLDAKQIGAIFDRRDRMKAEIDTLIAEKGPAAVLLR